MELRPLGNTGLRVTPLALGCWPISGMTSLDTSEVGSLVTLAAALDAGINCFDTAYCYGPHGESERLIARALGPRCDTAVIATKGAITRALQAGRSATPGADGPPAARHSPEFSPR